MQLKALILTVCGLFFSAPFSKASGMCRTPFTVRAAVERAPLLDGKTICIKGWVYPVPDADSAGRGVFITELLPTGTRMATKGRGFAIGLVGPSDTSPDYAQYAPDTFKKIDDLIEEGVTTPPVIEVVLRGVIAKNRRLGDKVAAELPSDDPFYDPLRKPSHSVEFIILEVISAKKVRLR